MTTYLGRDGFLCLGGKLSVTAGNIQLNGAEAEGQTTLNIDGTGLAGVVMPGDKFTIAGEAGAPVHTVTNSTPLAAVAGAVIGIQFTPAIAAGGAADNAAVTFLSNSVAEAKLWGLQASMAVVEDTALGDKWKTFKGEEASWSGNGEAHLDYDDDKQAEIIDRVLAGTPDFAVPGVLFGVAVGKQFYAQAVLTSLAVTGVQKGSIIAVQFAFTGSGPMLPNWS